MCKRDCANAACDRDDVAEQRSQHCDSECDGEQQATPTVEPSIEQPSIAPVDRLLTIPVNNQSGEVAVLVVARDISPGGGLLLAGYANPATVPAGARRNVVFGVSPINQPEWGIFVNPGTEGTGPLLTQWDVEHCSGFIDVEIVVTPVGSPTGGPFVTRRANQHAPCLSL